MQVTLKCKISLSKKMRNLLQDGGRVILTSDSLTSGKGEALLVLTDNTNNNLDLNDLIDKETSIMLTPVSATNELSPPAPVSNLFSNSGGQQGGVNPYAGQPPNYGQANPQNGEQANLPNGIVGYNENGPIYTQPQMNTPLPQQRNPIDRMAATQPPEHGQNNHAYYQQEEIQVPKQFEVTQQPDFMEFVKNIEELQHAVTDSKNKRSDIALDSIGNDRERALAQERKDMEESIGKDAYVVNEKCASLAINDLGLDLRLNMPRNLGMLPAKKLAQSRELWSLFRSNHIRIVSPNEAQHLLKNAGSMSQTYVPQLEIYDSAYDAEDNFNWAGGSGREQGAPRTPILDLEMNTLDGPTEEMANLRMAGRVGAAPRTANATGDASSLSGSTRRSYHGSGGMGEASLDELFSGDDYSIDEHNRHVNTHSRRNSKGINTIASRHRP